MEYIKKENEHYNLHMIKTDKFKSTSIEIIFSREIKKEEITLTNFLTSIMTYTTKKYNTKIKFAQELENLYAARVFPSCYRLGKNMNVDFNMKVLNDKYAEDGLLDKAFEFLKEVIFNPKVENNEFSKDEFEIIKNEEISQIERFKEDTRKYAMLRLMELTDSTKPFSYNLKGYMEDLNKITRANLYDFYKKFINDSTVDIFIVGNIDFDKVSKIVFDKFNFLNKKIEKDSLMIEWNDYNKERKEVVENDNTNQAKLGVSCRLQNITKFERDYVLNIYNTILGGTPDSKFFKTIREKFSLCYSVLSGANKLDNLLIITSGIAKENFKKAMILIEKEMDNMKKGDFTKEEIDRAKVCYLSGLDEIEDNPHQIIAHYYAMDKLGSDDLDVKRKMINKVTKEDIIKLSNKIYIDTVFLLGGDKK